MLLDTDRDTNIDFLGKKVHILLSDIEFKGEGPAPSGSRPPLYVAHMDDRTHRRQEILGRIEQAEYSTHGRQKIIGQIEHVEYIQRTWKIEILEEDRRLWDEQNTQNIAHVEDRTRRRQKIIG